MYLRVHGITREQARGRRQAALLHNLPTSHLCARGSRSCFQTTGRAGRSWVLGTVVGAPFPGSPLPRADKTPRDREARTCKVRPNPYQAQATGTVYIFCGLGLASCRWRQLTSNVRPHKPQAPGIHRSAPPAVDSSDLNSCGTLGLALFGHIAIESELVAPCSLLAPHPSAKL